MRTELRYQSWIPRWSFVLLLTVIASLQKTWAWTTIEGGVNITHHANVNVGPPYYVENSDKYNLTVFGDLNVGGAPAPLGRTWQNTNIFVNGSIVANEIVFFNRSVVTKTPQFVFARANLASTFAGVDYIYHYVDDYGNQQDIKLTGAYVSTAGANAGTSNFFSFGNICKFACEFRCV